MVLNPRGLRLQFKFKEILGDLVFKAAESRNNISHTKKRRHLRVSYKSSVIVLLKKVNLMVVTCLIARLEQ